MRSSRVIVNLGCQHKITMNFWSFLVNDHYSHARPLRFILGELADRVLGGEPLQQPEMAFDILHGCHLVLVNPAQNRSEVAWRMAHPGNYAYRHEDQKRQSQCNNILKTTRGEI